MKACVGFGAFGSVPLCSSQGGWMIPSLPLTGHSAVTPWSKEYLCPGVCGLPSTHLWCADGSHFTRTLPRCLEQWKIA